MAITKIVKEKRHKCYNKVSLAALAFVLALIVITVPAQSQDLDVPYVPTPQNIVDRMLDVADVQPGDYVIDLGSGDGRIVISAVKRGAWGHGIDLNPKRIEEARANAEKEGISDRVMFLEQNLFETDFSQASVITMYLLNSVNRKLRPHLLEKLEPGTRIVSHSFDMGDWEPDEEHKVKSETSGGTHTVYYWVIPAQAEGEWNWNVDGEPFSMNVSQQYQNITPEVSNGGTSLEVSESILRGKRIGFVAENGNKRYIFSGRLEGDIIKGTAQIHEGDNSKVTNWEASRK